MKYRVLVNDKEVAIIEAEGTAFSLGISPVIEEVPEKKSLAQEIAGTKLINANWSNTGIYLSADSAQKIVDLVLTRFDEAAKKEIEEADMTAYFIRSSLQRIRNSMEGI